MLNQQECRFASLAQEVKNRLEKPFSLAIGPDRDVTTSDLGHNNQFLATAS